ncbi:MAG TPA: hypothetical protein VFB31_06595 [Pseudolabrys sp.]|nr:hypothetical protein [Pseudolabrys sp.]
MRSPTVERRDPRFMPGWWILPGLTLGTASWIGLFWLYFGR